MTIPLSKGYSRFMFDNSIVHLLTVDLSKFEIRPIPVWDSFPMFQWGAHALRPPELAKAAGALACVGGGFEMTVYAGLGVWAEPLHPLIVDYEMWTTGIGPGCGYLQFDGSAKVQPCQIFVSAWRKGLPALPFHIDHVNRGHDGTVLFTPRGGTNEKPKRYDDTGKHLRFHTRLHKDPVSDAYTVGSQGTYPYPVLDHTVVIESDATLGFVRGDVVHIVYFDGLPRYAVVGMTQLLLKGVDVAGPVYGGPDPGGPDAPYAEANPRTALGVDQLGTTAYIVVVEGRIPPSSGVTLKKLAGLMKQVGAYDATNMDGGGSSHMWIRGEKVPGLEWGLVADSCYGNGTLDGTRPNIYATAVFAR